MNCNSIDLKSCKISEHHIRHTNIKVFQCDFNKCNKVFKNKSVLNKHKNSVHLNVRYVCDWSECRKQFIRKSHLLQHKSAVHLNEKTFQCNEENCGKRFSRNSHLIQHKRIHSGEKPFVCHFNDCKKAFTQKTQLNRHLKRKFKCRYNKCNEYYSDNNALKQHIIVLRQKILTGHPFTNKAYPILFLTDKYDISDDCIFSVNDPSVSHQILVATDGQGVDVVLSALSNQRLVLTEEVVGQYGRWIDLDNYDSNSRGFHFYIIKNSISTIHGHINLHHSNQNHYQSHPFPSDLIN
ncbi:unnamed protein product [Oppiella nova]|uniref:C2H2-type domain-containing protein n=1 Tax=Oppiella nova TaxID=334625 RepID=A0A7R9M5D9_9ACAR|nr:unnamed protein product [Oppiella nova]CAG2169922.1 unnamed protein product [Oppiella nova]